MSPQQNTAGQAKLPAPRKRGGQPGNSNAWKHGFYTKNFTLAERKGLQAANGIVLGDEIALLRVLKLKRPQAVSAQCRTHGCAARPDPGQSGSGPIGISAAPGGGK